MLNKKKATQKKGAKCNKKSAKFDHQADTLITTKQRTYATIQEPTQFHEHKISTRTTHFSSKRDYIDQMQAHRLSPFSSPEKSISPIYRKSMSPMVVKQQVKRKLKQNSVIQKINENKKITMKQKKDKKTFKQKPGTSKKVKAQFQNQFLKRMSRIQGLEQKKITELSEEEMEASIKKIHRPLEIRQLKLGIKKNDITLHRKPKKDAFKEMHLKIKQKYKKMYPKLGVKQLKVLTAVVLIQRLWKQKKVKDMIGDFLSPRSSAPYQQLINRNINVKDDKKDYLEGQDMVQEVNSIKTEYQLSNNDQKQEKNEPNAQIPQSLVESDQILLNFPKSKKVEECSIDLKSLELSDDFSETSSAKKCERVLNYIEMYRDVTLMKKKEKIKRKNTKTNIFNIPESLSQKCLLSKLYYQSLKKVDRSKIYNKEAQVSHDFIFPIKSAQKTREQFLSPKKPQIVELEERFYTEAQDQELAQQNKQKDNIKKQAIKPEDHTVGNIGMVSQYIMAKIFEQFSQQFLGFNNKKCLKKKRRAPGITINQKTISQYLSEFIGFINTNYKQHINVSFTKITPMSFLKIFRVIPEEDIFSSMGSQDLSSEEDDEFSWPILPTTAFFQYQPIYEENIFIIKEDDKKYMNFLLGLIKIHNKCLVDCLSEYIEKERVDSFIFPWDTFVPYQKIQKKKCRKPIDTILDLIVLISNTKLGTLKSARYRDPDLEQAKLLLALKQDYKREGREWNPYSESLQIRLEVTEAIIQQIWSQVCQEVSTFLK